MIVRKSIFREKIRLTLTIIGVGFAVVLMLFQLGILFGTLAHATLYVESVSADIWVGQAGSASIMDGSMISDTYISKIRKVEGVDSAEALIIQPVLAKRADATTFKINLVGYVGDTEWGGPKTLTSGRRPKKEGELTLDETAAKTNKLKVGDVISINGKDQKIVGLSGGTSTTATNYAFVRSDSIGKLIPFSRMTSYVLVKVKSGVSADTVSKRIEDQVSGVSAILDAKFIKNSRAFWIQQMAPGIGSMSTVALIVGIMVIGLTVYTLTLERSKEYGLLKALGASSWQLYRLVVVQAFLAGGIGFAVGILITAGIISLFTRFVPTVTPQLSVPLILIVLAAVLHMCLLSALIPLRRILRVDPLVVFER